MLLLAGCADQGPYYVKIPDVLSQDVAELGERVRIGGVFVEAPVSSPSGTMFTMAESLESEERINVYFTESDPLENGLNEIISN